MASTSFQPSEGVSLDSSLTQLESNLRFAITSRTQLPELLSAHESSRQLSDPSNLQSNEDNDFSIYELPALPSEGTRVRFLADLSEAEKTTEEASHVDLPILYGNNPITSESGTEGGDELDPVSQPARLNRPSTSSVRRLDDGFLEVSGRSRALLKTYFDVAKSFNLPLGHPTVIFSESRMYHLLRILADETLNMSYTTMERMVLDAESAALDDLRIETSESGESCTLGDISIPEERDSSGVGDGPHFAILQKNQVSLFQLPKCKRQQQLLYWGKSLNKNVVAAGLRPCLR